MAYPHSATGFRSARCDRADCDIESLMAITEGPAGPTTPFIHFSCSRLSPDQRQTQHIGGLIVFDCEGTMAFTSKQREVNFPEISRFSFSLSRCADTCPLGEVAGSLCTVTTSLSISDRPTAFCNQWITLERLTSRSRGGCYASRLI